MKSRWMVCAFALLLSCSSEDGGMAGNGGTGGTAGAGGTAGSGGEGGSAGAGGTGGAGGGSAVPTEGLLAHYPFSGDARDHSGNGYDGTVNGPVLATDRFGTSDGAYSLDGVDDVISLPHEPELDDGATAAGSLGAWVYRTTASWPLHIVGKREGCGGGINFMQLAIGGERRQPSWFPSTSGSI
ncbi:MAG: hypothetical protein OEQ49_06395 [Myxococcales bacterium]|nr:hypothetical protein [Myxococcales bacterium]